jgi:hypothetical protein
VVPELAKMSEQILDQLKVSLKGVSVVQTGTVTRCLAITWWCYVTCHVDKQCK